MRANEAAVAVVFFMCSLNALAQVQPGLWEISQRTEFNGRKQNTAPLKSRHCISPDQSGDPRLWTPRFYGSTPCTIRDYALHGDEANWNFVCQGEPSTTGAGRLRLSSQYYEGSNRVELHRGDERMNIIQYYEGRRMGECEGAAR